MWSIDGIEWEYPCDISRVSKVAQSEISGELFDRSYFSDVKGTYLRYSIKLVVPIGAEDDYTEIYETLTAPIDGHTFVLPYNQTTVTITGRVENVSDVYIDLGNGRAYWKGIAFDVIANHPTKSFTLSETLARGIAPLPQIVNIANDTIAQYIDGVWTVVAEVDADSKYY